MDSMQELIPFAKEMLRQKPGRGLLKIYLLGSVLACWCAKDWTSTNLNFIQKTFQCS
uniref:Uncharacterized protein n=1 Tax=Oryzias sinensis TaxID=183150 RepID=A0A8C8A382_9TELE